MSLLLLSCYKPPQASTLLDFFGLKTDIDALNTPIKVFVQVSGLKSGTLTIGNQLSESLIFNSNGTQRFPSLVKPGSDYSVSVMGLTGASLQQTCNINNPEGPVVFPFTTIYISCGTVFYDLSVQVVGLDPSISAISPLTVQNAGDKLNFKSDSTKTFTHKVGDSASYSISLVSVPTGHSCFFVPNNSGSGNISGGSLTVLLNCTSVLEIQPKSKLLTPGGKISIRISSHAVDPGSCSFSSITLPGKVNAALLTNPPTISYPGSPNDNIIQITANSPDFWGPAGNTFIRLLGCTAKGLEIQNGNPIQYDFTSTENIRLVDSSSGTDVPGCGLGTGANAFCESIERGITECNLSGTICSVFVSEGSYIPKTPILLSGNTSLFGGFAVGFPDLDSDPINHPTRIQDSFITSCGSNFFDFCNAILISTTSLDSTNKNLTVSGFQIQSNLDADYSAGIQITDSRTNLGKIFISHNIVAGNESNDTGSGIRAGLLINQSDNIVVTENWLRGGSGRKYSIGTMIEGSGSAAQPIVLARNLLDGLVSTDPNGFSAGVWIETGNFDAVILTENKINAYQYLNPGFIPENSYGIAFSDAVDSTLIINNDIFVGNSQTSSLGKATGIFLQSGVGIHRILNNQIFSNSQIGNSAGINFLTPPDSSSIIRGNNFYVSVPVVIGIDQYIFCSGVLNQDDCAHPIAGQFVGDYTNSYGDNPKFAGTNQIDQIWNYNTTTGTPNSANSPCTALYGGIDLNSIALPITVAPFIITDFLQNPRTTNSTPFTPSGAGSISIGALEADGNCL
ncbi:hypothetical protein EHQ64_08880 [Leptospira sarikeiensis]|uniref:Uncharacterized protein n=1 Tax=Leptospira sarikeiensis TaxID=2484943 RepID=A0A4R9KB93_9LEPT|nr:hypothetical protein EHQ64_08880 [Leptospira sarikeiensis]